MKPSQTRPKAAAPTDRHEDDRCCGGGGGIEVMHGVQPDPPFERISI